MVDPIYRFQGQQYQLAWLDDFSRGNLDGWIQDDFTSDGLHRTGYKFLELDGSLGSHNWSIVPGRWAALMDKHRSECQFVRDGQLVMKGHAVETANPYRVNFTDSTNRTHRYADYKLYTSWVSTWSRKWDNNLQRHVTDDNATTMLCEPGSVVEMKVNYEKQTMRAHRHSLWLMPATELTPSRPGEPLLVLASRAYNGDTADGVEIDGPERENPSRHNADFGNLALCKYVAGAAGDTPHALIDCRDFGIDLFTGWHTFTIVRHDDGTTTWLIDGTEVQRDTRPVLTSTYICLTREMNSGVKDPGPQDNPQPSDVLSDGPKRPRDPGLTAQSVILDLDLLDSDEIVIDYVAVWTLDGNLFAGTSPVALPAPA